MKERPIIFSAPMVRAILAGTKTQTRRVLKGAQPWGTKEGKPEWAIAGTQPNCPYGQPGDRLWVREASRFLGVHDHVPPRELFSGPIWYEAQDAVPFHRSEFGKLRPSMFMPRWASRITLEVVSVRVERLQDISEADARSEGVEQIMKGRFRIYGRETDGGDMDRSARTSYRSLWESINGPGSWDLNPWAWVVEFKRVQP